MENVEEKLETNQKFKSKHNLFLTGKVLKNKNGAKGITLIALVITIIVLLILAAVSISTLTGDDGILAKANEAAIQTNLGTVKESYSLYRTENYEKNKEDFTKLLKKVAVGEEGEYVYVIQDLEELKLDNLGDYGIGEIPESVSEITDFNNLYIVDEYDNVSYVVDGKIYGEIGLAKKEKGDYPLLKDIAKRGDYIAYNIGNGYTGKWRCIFNDADGVEIVSTNILGKVTLDGGYYDEDDDYYEPNDFESLKCFNIY